MQRLCLLSWQLRMQQRRVLGDGRHRSCSINTLGDSSDGGGNSYTTCFITSCWYQHLTFRGSAKAAIAALAPAAQPSGAALAPAVAVAMAVPSSTSQLFIRPQEKKKSCALGHELYPASLNSTAYVAYDRLQAAARQARRRLRTRLRPPCRVCAFQHPVPSDSPWSMKHHETPIASAVPKTLIVRHLEIQKWRHHLKYSSPMWHATSCLGCRQQGSSSLELECDQQELRHASPALPTAL